MTATTISDTERREVARRLREIRLCKSGHIEWWKIAQALGLKESAGWFGWEKFEPDSVNRLADLIDPDESGHESGQNPDSVPKESPTVQKAPECDREALLALADEFVEKAEEVARYIESSDGDFDRHAIDAMDEQYGYARRIREALGVDE